MVRSSAVAKPYVDMTQCASMTMKNSRATLDFTLVNGNLRSSGVVAHPAAIVNAKGTQF